MKVNIDIVSCTPVNYNCILNDYNPPLIGVFFALRVDGVVLSKVQFI